MIKRSTVWALGIWTALIAVVLLAGSADAHGRHGGPMTCPKGYDVTEVHVYGQRIELGIDPVTHESNLHQVVQNGADFPTDDPRYVVALVCVRGLTAAERDAAFWGRDTPAVDVPLKSYPPKDPPYTPSPTSTPTPTVTRTPTTAPPTPTPTSTVGASSPAAARHR